MNESDLELADLLAQKQRERGIKSAQQAIKPEKHPHFDGLHCVDCEAEIPEPRLKMGRVRCVGCQSYIERLKT